MASDRVDRCRRVTGQISKSNRPVLTVKSFQALLYILKCARIEKSEVWFSYAHEAGVEYNTETSLVTICAARQHYLLCFKIMKLKPSIARRYPNIILALM
jgi:hypothetical protein